ncbi:MAG: biotin synthase BioB [Betaproteobacteria bacterium]|nr:biotin synthase BioB [Betaproteobacteria bacterium]
MSDEAVDQAATTGRGAWRAEEVKALFALPFNDLLYRAQTVHRAHFDPNAMQLSTLLSIKTGGCSEDCKYCSQSAHHDTALEAEPLLDVERVVEAAQAAKASGATRFCMGAAWRGPKARDLQPVLDMVRAVRALGLETCVTLGLLQDGQAEELAQAGLDYYNHNLDTSPEFYGEVVSTRAFDDRLDTLAKVRAAGIRVCSGGIVGMGETRTDRASLLAVLANLTPPPESVPINMLVPVEGTPLCGSEPLDPFDFIRTIAVARIVMPTSYVRLSAGRAQLPEAAQALCFLAGANSIFYGDRLLTTDNQDAERDRALLEKLDMHVLVVEEKAPAAGGGAGCGCGTRLESA